MFKDRLEILVGEQSFRSFAKKCGISDSVIRAYVRGDSDPTLRKIEKIAIACNVSVGWLAAGEGEKSEKAEEKTTDRNVHLRSIFEWMDAKYSGDDEDALIFYEEVKDAFEDFAEFIEEKKRTGGSGVAARMHDDKQKTA